MTQATILQDAGVQRASLQDRITHVLEELRVVLPGTQALLGFQFVAVFSNGFSGLESWQKGLHLVSLLLVTLGAMLLMTPAAYHRIVDEGGDSEAMHAFATRCLMLALGALAAGLSCDVLLIGDVILKSFVAAVGVAVLVGATALFAWFGLPMAIRAKRRSARNVITTQSR